MLPNPFDLPLYFHVILCLGILSSHAVLRQHLSLTFLMCSIKGLLETDDRHLFRQYYLLEGKK